MKRFFKLIAIAAVALVGLQSCEKNDSHINAALLPDAAKSFLSAHYGSMEILGVVKDYDDLGYTYDVRLADGTLIEFRKNGEWKQIENRSEGVVGSVIPAKIADYLTTNYPTNFVIDIERERHYDVELNDGLDLEFGLDGDFIRIDR